MKVFVILFIAALAGAAGFLFGTDKGRQCKNDVIARARKRTNDATDNVADSVTDAADTVTDAVDDTVERLTA